MGRGPALLLGREPAAQHTRSALTTCTGARARLAWRAHRGWVGVWVQGLGFRV